VGTEKRMEFVFVPTFLCLVLLLSACADNSTSLSTPLPTPSNIPIITIVPNILIGSTATPDCYNGLTFLSDITIPDNSSAQPGASLDKQWLINNSGTCNWDVRYRLRLVGGNAMGALPEQTLFPARSGKQAVIRIVFVAPQESGVFLSEWQAYDAHGASFGDTFFMKINVH